MNNIKEIKEQSKFDCLIKMYGYLAQAILEVGGNRGERAVRMAVSCYGEGRGESLRNRFSGRGIAANLDNLLKAENCCGEDPRFVRTQIKGTEQVQLFEVYRCPMEWIWKNIGCTAAGMLYCEECVHGIVRGYTGGKGQANLSNFMTCSRDSFCRFALYLRPANLDSVQKEECFPASEHPQAVCEYDVEEQFIQLYGQLVKEAREFLEQDGVAALTGGMDKLKKDILKSLVKEAEKTGEKLDKAFVKSYFPVGICDKNRFEEICPDKEAWQILRIHLLSSIEDLLSGQQGGMGNV